MNKEAHLSTGHNIASKLSEFAVQFPDKKILIFANKPDNQEERLSYRHLSYAQLHEKVNRLAYSLKQMGVRKGDRIVVMVPMSMELYILIIALLKMGAITVFIDPWVGKRQMVHCCKLTQPKAFIGIRKAHLLRLLSPVIRRIPLKIMVHDRPLFRERKLESLIEQGKDAFKTAPVSKEDTALITFTTGSTGKPKGANRTHGFLLAQQEVLSKSIALSADDTDFPALPIFVLKNMANAVTSVIPLMNPLKPAEVDPQRIVQQFQDWKITASIGSPAFYEILARYCIEKDITLNTVRALYTGGGPVKPELIRMLTQILPRGKVVVVYGSTEAEPISHIEGSEIIQETALLTNEGHGNCVGKPIEEIRVRIIKIVDGPVSLQEMAWDELVQPDGATGEIIVSGKHVNRDYYRNPEAVKENKIRDHSGGIWHRTGDTGYFDEKGRLWLVGRIKNRLTKAGKEFFSLQIEPVIDQLEYVFRSALIGIPDQTGNQQALIIIEVAHSFRNQVRHRMAEWKGEITELCRRKGIEIDGVHSIQKIPVDPRHNTKTDYTKLKKRFQKR